MLSELDETIRQLLIKEGGLDPTEIEVAFDIPNREWSGAISKPTLNCYLFDIHENVELRQQGMRTEKQGTAQAVRRRPPLYFDLTYLVTAWTRAVEDEHRLIWHALRTLARFATMPTKHLQGVLREYDMPIFTRTAQPNGVLKSPSEFWTALENQLKPSLAYVVTLSFERDALPAGPPTLSTRFRFGSTDTTPEDFIWFGGTVRDEQGDQVSGAVVEIEGSAQRDVTDTRGNFRLKVPREGRYTLVTRRGDLLERRELDIPNVSYDITLPKGE